MRREGRERKNGGIGRAGGEEIGGTSNEICPRPSKYYEMSLITFLLHVGIQHRSRIRILRIFFILKI